MSTLVNTFGNGLWMVVSALYLTRSVGLSIGQTGLALTITALVSLVVSTPLGYLTDRVGPRGMLVGGLGAMAVGTAALTLVDSFVSFLLVAVPTAVFEAAQRAAKGAVIAGAVPLERRVYTRAYLRSLTNIGISGGAAVAGLGLAVDTRAAYLTLILIDATTYLLAAGILSRLAPIPAVPAPATGPRLIALRDRPFLAFVVLDGLMATHFGLFEVALPLWVAHRTDAPRWVIAALFLVNTTAVVLLQVRAARGTDDLAGAAAASRRAGFALLAGCGLFALSGTATGAVTVALLMAGAALHVGGELWHAAAGWSISFGLAPADAHGQYQGAYAMGMQLGRIVAPLVVTSLALGGGTPGWLLLGAAFATIGCLVPPVVRWARRMHPHRSEPVAQRQEQAESKAAP
ncbi:MFS transporter [Couchioplanes caeruleus]|uniref:MFS transporter n=1 Tax=Couchioplanes caeruleus TaxID=56438 RepID=UPI001FD1315F|nr:MFS transporter [Couchioplanes caeruleus]